MTKAYSKEEINLIILSSLNALTYKMTRRLLDDFNSSEPDFDCYENFLIKTLSRGVYNIVKGKFYDRGYRSSVLSGLESKGIICITYFSESYPESLKNIPDPPVLLYCKGDTSLLKGRCFSIVGSRKTPPSPLGICKKLSGGISREFTIVTGLAEGADSAAAEGALEKSGKVISVLAYGFDHVYPSCNASLLNRIVKHGLAVSEFPPEVQPKPYNFPFRNRIIAGLSSGTLVVSAGKKSGALITANLALDYGRDVFAVPYAPWTSSGEGCNLLIKNGAALCDCVEDILNCYGIENIPVKISLSGEEQILYEAVRAEGEAFVAKLAERLQKQPFELMPIISALEIKGLIVRLGGNRYSALQI